MAQHPTRAYQVINPSALFGPGAVIRFRHTAPAGSTVGIRVNGRLVRVLLTDTPLHSGRFVAELQAYL